MGSEKDGMKRSIKSLLASIFVSLFPVASSVAGPYEDGVAAYERGDYAKAVELFRKAAEQGNADAQFNLGQMYDQGKGVKQDYAKAVAWYGKAAEQGDAYAQYNLGVAYREGLGVKQDYDKAADWFIKAANQGVIEVQFSLAGMYFMGQGVPQDYVEAHKWWNLSASLGENDAAAARDEAARKMTPAQIAEAQRLAREWKPKR